MARAKVRAMGPGNLSIDAGWICSLYLQTFPTTLLEISFAIQRVVVVVVP